ncbi:hypothetical protein OH802_06490 [Nocardioides sp. NBC_00850]|uniref:hypothetical protein n=1 Tax=Nocardioides sp. NBC_00850 TaxID=2976001 RepID=UPI00386A0994|nr:hypothetical protein OH802_06490 [Nocardioides sp. NBC_00850]
MIEIDVPTDLAAVERDGLVRGRMRRDRALLKPGDVIIAGRPARWSWARVRGIDKMTVTLELITEQEAASAATLVAAPSPSTDWPWPRLPWLRLEQHTFTSLDTNTFMWVDHFVFSIDSTLPDEELLTGLLSSADYAHDFASPYRYGADVGFEDRPIHARWFADLLTVQMFSRVDAVYARRSIHLWIVDEILEPPQTPRTHARVDAVLDRALGSGEIYRLDVPEGDDLVHEYGFVVGATGFQEYVAIDWASETMHLLVASDD